MVYARADGDILGGDQGGVLFAESCLILSGVEVEDTASVNVLIDRIKVWKEFLIDRKSSPK